MRRPWIQLAILLTAFALAPAAAAGDGVKGHFSFGPSFTSGNASNFLDDGWALRGGATWFRPGRPIGIRADFGVDWWDMKNSALAQIDTDPTTLGIQPPDNGHARIWSGTANIVWQPQRQGTVGFYLTGGAGAYYAQWALSENGYGTGWWCDAWWGVCYPGVVETEYLLKSGSAWRWGLNAGAGVTFKTSQGEVFVEADYHWVDTKNQADMIPVTIGYRW